MVKQERAFNSGLTSANFAIFDKACASVYVASEDDTIKIFSANTGEKEGELKGHEDSVLDLTFDSQREGILVSASADFPSAFGNELDNNKISTVCFCYTAYNLI